MHTDVRHMSATSLFSALAISTVIVMSGCGKGSASSAGPAATTAGQPPQTAPPATASATASATHAQAPTRPNSTFRRQHPGRSDLDHDYAGHGYYDVDDHETLHYGRAATRAERAEVKSLIDRYYAAAVAGDGKTGCSLSYSLYAEGIPENYGNQPGLAGNTCPAVMSKLFAREHAQLVAERKILRLTGVRADGDRGYALLGEGGNTQRFFYIHRDSGVWRMEALESSEFG